MKLSKRARRLLALALGIAVITSITGLVIHRQAHAAAVPSSAQTRADLAQMQVLLDSGSAARQAALLVPGFTFAPGSGPIVPAGMKVKILPATFRTHGQLATVNADASGATVTLSLVMDQGHWRLYHVAPAGAKAQAASPPAANAQLTASMTADTVKACPAWQDLVGKTPVVLIHGYAEGPSVWSQAPQGGGSAMYDSVNDIGSSGPGGTVWTSTFDYSMGNQNQQWVGEHSGPRFAAYLKCVAAASRQAGGPGKVIVVTHSMGGLVTRWATSKGGASADIAEVITIATPNTGDFFANFMVTACLDPYSAEVAAINALTGSSNICAGMSAFWGMSALGPDIDTLPPLPSGIPLYAIAGDETIRGITLWGAHLNIGLDGDGIVTLGSAHADGGTPYTFSCLSRSFEGLCWHNGLPSYQPVIAQVTDLVQQFVTSHPAPAPQPATSQAPGCDGSSPPCVQFVTGGDNPTSGDFGEEPWSGVEPTWMALSGDSTLYIGHITWQTWDTATTAGGSATATGTGYWEENSCTPSCAQGAFSATPVTITLSNPQWFGNGELEWQTMTTSVPAPGDTVTMFTWGGAYPAWWPPRAGTSSALSSMWPT
jgi:pimeloyl-ACP methyl ester carboxylesterase